MNNIPKEKHFAVIFKDSVYHEGDERSRTNPGHGYPAHTTYHWTYEPFKSEAEMAKWVECEEKKNYGKREYTIIEANPKAVKVETKITLV